MKNYKVYQCYFSGNSPILLPLGPGPDPFSYFNLLRQRDWEFFSLVILLIVRQGTQTSLSSLGVSFLCPQPRPGSLYSNRGSNIASSVGIPDSLDSLGKKEGKLSEWN